METKQITNSSQVIEIGYDKDSKIFVVTYSNKAKYNYYDVEPNLWDKATSAESTGKFISAFIKPHKFKKVA